MSAFRAMAGLAVEDKEEQGSFAGAEGTVLLCAWKIEEEDESFHHTTFFAFSGYMAAHC